MEKGGAGESVRRVQNTSFNCCRMFVSWQCMKETRGSVFIWTGVEYGNSERDV